MYNITNNEQAGRVLYGLRVRAERIIRQHEAMVSEPHFYGLDGIQQGAYDLHRAAVALVRYFNSWGRDAIDFSGVDEEERKRVGLD